MKESDLRTYLTSPPNAVLDDYLLLAPASNDRIVVLNPEAHAVWKAYESGLSVTAIANALCNSSQEAEIERQRLNQLFANWRQQGLIDGESQTAPAESHENSQPGPVVDCQNIHDTALYRIGDHVIQIQFGDAQVSKAVQPLLAHLQLPADNTTDLQLTIFNSEQQWRLSLNGRQLHCADTMPAAIVDLFYFLGEYGSANADNLLILHGAILDWNGCRIAMPAKGGSGKTTLAVILHQAGAACGGDDIVPIRQSSLDAHPLAMPFCIKQGSWPVLTDRNISWDGAYECQRDQQKVRYLPPFGAISRKPAPVDLLVIPEYQPEADHKLRSLSAIETLQQLIGSESLINLPITQQRLERLVSWIQSIRGYQLQYSSLDEAAGTIQYLAMSS